MRKIAGFSVVAAGLVFGLACGGDDDDDPMGGGGGAGMGGMAMAGNAGTGGSGMGMAPAEALGRDNPPVLDTRMDRAGRVAITAALIGAFQPAKVDADAKRDAYNQGSSLQPEYLEDIERSLGILDGLDLDCGNQFAAGMGVRQYSALAGVLSDDQLYLDSNVPHCPDAYLGLEGGRPGGCGGRLPNEDVIDISYSVLAIGAFSGVGDGVPGDDANHSPDFFPFIGAPR